MNWYLVTMSQPIFKQAGGRMTSGMINTSIILPLASPPSATLDERRQAVINTIDHAHRYSNINVTEISKEIKELTCQDGSCYDIQGRRYAEQILKGLNERDTRLVFDIIDTAYAVYGPQPDVTEAEYVCFLLKALSACRELGTINLRYLRSAFLSMKEN